jgi:hypothetical protein
MPRKHTITTETVRAWLDSQCAPASAQIQKDYEFQVNLLRGFLALSANSPHSWNRLRRDLFETAKRLNGKPEVTQSK